MKQELVRTKSKISSLKREMSSIQQLHLAQQQVHAQLSAPTIISSRQEIEQYHQQSPSVFTYDQNNLSTNPTCTAQSTQTTSRSPPSTIINFTNLLTLNKTPASSINCDSSLSPSDEQLRLYLTETLQREKDSAV
jgi:hypothetical protein